jgi:large subunit ribosomal protein L4
MAILAKLRDKEAIIVDDLSFAAPKTKEMATVLDALKLSADTCLIGTETMDENIYKSGRNITGVKVLPAEEFNTWIVLRQKKLVLTKGALELLRKKGTEK